MVRSTSHMLLHSHSQKDFNGVIYITCKFIFVQMAVWAQVSCSGETDQETNLNPLSQYSVWDITQYCINVNVVQYESIAFSFLGVIVSSNSSDIIESFALPVQILQVNTLTQKLHEACSLADIFFVFFTARTQRMVRKCNQMFHTDPQL